MDIKLPVPIIDAKTMLSFSTPHKLPHSKISRLCQDLFQHREVVIQDFLGPEISKDEFQDFSGLW